MIKVELREYSVNTILSVFLAIIVFWPFYLVFGNTLAIWSAILVVGMPHFILGALGYLTPEPKRAMGLFSKAVVFGLFLTFIYYRVLAPNVAPVFFLAYFLWHLLINEQMFESTIRAGYSRWQNSWPIFTSWGLIVAVLLSLSIAAYYHLKIDNFVLIMLLWLIFLALLVGLVADFFRRRERGDIPYGFMVFFVIILIPLILLIGRFFKSEAYAVTTFLALYHFMAWYVFYTKKLLRFPKDYQLSLPGAIFYGWKKNVWRFWAYVFTLQLFWVLFLVIYLVTPFGAGVKYLVAPEWAPFWTIIHVTTSFLPKPGTLPRLPHVFTSLRLRLS